jgi:hypothetical protein
MFARLIDNFRDGKSEIIIKQFLNVSAFLYILLIFLDNVYDFSFFKILTAMFCLVIFIVLLYHNSVTTFEYFSIAVVFGITLLISLFSGRIPLSFLFTRFLVLSFCGIIIASGEFRSSLAKTLLLLQLAVLIFYIFILQYNPNHVLTSSRNSISIHLLSFCLIVYLTDYIDGKKRPHIWPALTVMIMSIVANGRSGMVVSILLFLTVLIFNIKYLYSIIMNKYKFNKIMFFLFFSVFAVISFFLLYYILPQLIDWYKASRFNSEGMYSLRYKLWGQFFSELNLKRAIFGYDLKNMPIQVIRNGIVITHSNPHNSFLDLWAKTGIIAFPILIITILTVWYLNKKSLFLAIIFMLFLLRSSTDMVIYLRRSDYVFFAYMFLALKDTNMERNISSSKYLINIKNIIDKIKNRN